MKSVASAIAPAELFPEIEPYRTFRLKVDAIHELYVEEVGRTDGQPVVFLHGGPGGGISSNHRRLFDPSHYRAILFDQRGAGQSTPHAGNDLKALENNTTWDLVADIEKIRIELGIERWVVFGGSWGSSLALAYAEKHPERVSALVLRGIFLCTSEELHWFYQGPGVNWMFPDLWEKYLAPIPDVEREAMIPAYYHRLVGSDTTVALQCAKAWSQWEAATCKLLPDPKAVEEMEDPEKALAFARIEAHYFFHKAFLSPHQLLRDAHLLANIPTEIIHGRYDVICPATNAWELKKAMPHASLQIIPDAGHAYNEPSILKALLAALERFKKLK